MKITLSEIKKNLQGTYSGVDEAKNRVNDLEHKEEKHSIRQQEEKRMQKAENSVRSLWDNFKSTNIQIIGVLEGEEKEQEIGNIFEKIVKANFPNLGKEIDMKVQETQRVPNKMDAKKTTPRYIIIKMSKVKDKERILKGARKK